MPSVEKEIEILDKDSPESLAIAMRDIEDIGEDVSIKLKGSFEDRIIANLISAQFDYCQRPSNYNRSILRLFKFVAVIIGVENERVADAVNDGIILSNGANSSRSFK